MQPRARYFPKRRNRHRTDATGNRGNHTRPFLCHIKLHITAQTAIFQTVDTDINHNRTGLNPTAFKKFGIPTPTTKISAAATSSARFCVALWHTVTVARANNSSKAWGLPTIFEAPTTTAFSLLDRPRILPKASSHLWAYMAASAAFSPPAVLYCRMEAVHIFMWNNIFQNGLTVDMCRQRKLHQNTVHSIILIQPPDQIQQLFLGSRFGQLIRQRTDTAFFKPAFCGHIPHWQDHYPPE